MVDVTVDENSYMKVSYTFEDVEYTKVHELFSVNVFLSNSNEQMLFVDKITNKIEFCVWSDLGGDLSWVKY